MADKKAHFCILGFVCLYMAFCPFAASASDEQTKIEQLETLLQFYMQENATLKSRVEELEASVGADAASTQGTVASGNKSESTSASAGSVETDENQATAVASPSSGYKTKFPNVDDTAICDYATYVSETSGKPERVWSSGLVADRYVDDAQKRGLTCGVGDEVAVRMDPAGEQEPPTVSSDYKTRYPDLDDTAICDYATYVSETSGEPERVWSSGLVANRYVEDAKNRGLTCSVGEKVQTASNINVGSATNRGVKTGKPEPGFSQEANIPLQTSSKDSGLLSKDVIVDEVKVAGTRVWGRLTAAGDFDRDGMRELVGMPAAEAYLNYIREPKSSNDKAYWIKGAKLSQSAEWRAKFYTYQLNSDHFAYKLKGAQAGSSSWKVNFDGDEGCVHPSQLLTAYLNADAFVDFVIVCHGYDRYPFPGEHSLVAISDGPNSYKIKSFTKQPSFYHDGATADFDGDGSQDILLLDAKKLRVFLNDGNGEFRPSDRYFPQFATWKGAYSTEIIDVDEDGHFDVFVAGHEDDKHGSQPTVFLLGNEKNKFSNDNKITIASVKGYGVVLDVIKEGKHLFLVRTGSGKRSYKGAVIQHFNLEKMETVDVIIDEDTKHGGRIFRKSDEKGRLRFGGLTDRSGGIDVVFDGEKLTPVK